ncbi:MAG: winged helix-turn-helix transcriptional regulator [Candidatus Thorarchaeota archaeon]
MEDFDFDLNTESILLHPLRRKIYSIIAEKPGNSMDKISKALNTASSTIGWHLQRLENAGLLKSGKFSGKRVYYPASLRSEQAEEIIQILSNENTRKIFRFILNNSIEKCYPVNISREIKPPVSHKTVSYHLGRLKKVNMVQSIKIGNNICYELGSESYKLKEHGLNVISDSYLNHLMEVLDNECLFPEIISKTDKKLILQIICPNGQEIFLNLDLSDWDFQGIIDEIPMKENQLKH